MCRSLFDSDSPNTAYWHFVYEETCIRRPEEGGKLIYDAIEMFYVLMLKLY